MKKLALILGFFISLTVQAAAPMIWENGDYGKMLTKLGFHLYDNKAFRSLVVDPTAGGGVPAAIGSLGLRDNAGVGEAWFKFGVADTDWINVLFGNTGWQLLGNTGTNSAINFVGTTDAQDFVIKANSVTQLTFLQTGGWTSDQDTDPTDGVTKTQYSLQTDLDPTASTTTANNAGIGNLVNYDGGNTGFDFAGNVSAMTNRYTHQGTGTVNTVTVSDNSAQFGSVAGTTSLFKGNSLDVQIGSGYTVNAYNGVNSYLNANTSILGGVNMFDSNAVITDATVNSANIFSGFITLFGTSAASGTIQGPNTNISLQDSSTSNSLIGARFGANTSDTSVAGGVEGVTSNVLLQDDSVVSGQSYGANFAASLQNNATSNGVTGVLSNVALQDASSGGNAIGANFAVNITGTASASSVNGINTNSDIAGSGAVGNVNSLAVGGNIHGSNAVGAYAGAQITPTLQGTASATDFTGVSISPNVQGTATVTNPVTGLNVTVSSTPVIPGAKGLNVSLTGANVADPYSKQAIVSDGGTVTANYGYTIPGATTFFQTHFLGAAETVALGDPTNTYGFGNNFAHSITFNDDWGPDVTTLRLGFSSVGYVGQVIGAVGKTMDSWTGSLSGFGNPSGAGTIDQAIMFRAAGGLAQGGALTINNAYGFYGMSTLCAIANNCWGTYIEDTAADNWFAKNVVVDGAGTPTTQSVGLEVAGTTKAFLPSRLTTAQRNALTATLAMLIWNTTTAQYEYYDGAVWVPLASGSSASVASHMFHLTGGVSVMDDIDGIRRISANSTLNTIQVCAFETGSSGNTTVDIKYDATLSTTITVNLPGTGGPGCVVTTPAVALTTGDLVNASVTAVANGAPEDLSIELIY